MVVVITAASLITVEGTVSCTAVAVVGTDTRVVFTNVAGVAEDEAGACGSHKADNTALLLAGLLLPPHVEDLLGEVA